MTSEKGKARKRKPIERTNEVQSALSIKAAKEVEVLQFEDAFRRAMDTLSPRTEVNSILEKLYQLRRNWLHQLAFSSSSQKYKTEASARVGEIEQEITNFQLARTGTQ